MHPERNIRNKRVMQQSSVVCSFRARATVRYEAARRGRELVSVRGLTVDELVKELMEAAVGGWISCSLCGARVEVRRMPEHTANVRLKPARTGAHGGRNI